MGSEMCIRDSINTARIYNPYKQSMDQDPEGIFIRQYVPELKTLDNLEIHQPLNLNGKYPKAIVDQPETYRYARQQLSTARRKEGFREEAEAIRVRIASRKK